MRILHLIQKKQNRGAETFTCQLGNHQRKQGHEVKIVAIYEAHSELDWDEEIICLKGTISKRFIDFKAWKNLKNIISEFKPDIVQANAGDTLKYAVFSKLLYRWDAPLIFRNASEVGKYIKTPFQKKFNAILYRNVDQILSVSELSKNDIVHYFPFLKSKTFVIPIGIESKKVQANVKFDPNLKHIVHVGGFTFEKNHKEVIEIFELLRKEDKGTHLHLIGDGPLRMEIEKIVRVKCLDQHVTFHGFVNNPLAFIKAGNVLILPSIIEGLPAVILEAMYCKTLVVAYSVGGISEILNKKTGELITPNDQDAFVNATRNAINRNYPEKINKAFEMVKLDFMNTEITKEFLRKYRLLKKS